VPTRIIFIVAPINVILNVTLGKDISISGRKLILTRSRVWGPAPIRLGFIGAPVATALSFNLVSLMSAIYGIFFVPKTAWHPLTMQSFTGLWTLSCLGLSGVGMINVLAVSLTD
jgi:MATE family multidrug resistance protein